MTGQSGPSFPCEACIAARLPECCSEEHTPSVLRLAITIAHSLRNEQYPLIEQAQWYIEDAAAVADEVQEGDGWVVHHDPVDIGEFFIVNGVEFWNDINAEGFNTPVLATVRRTELAEEATWEDE